MDSLEKELTCSICTELLYQPLTLLDCLHTFCGACLKEWFSWQATAAENAPTPPAPGSPVFTCPSCRAAVRDTRHNATVATLLDMFLTGNPDKVKPDAEKEEMNKKYKPGDNILPKLNLDRSSEQQRLDEQDRRLIDQVREMSLRDAVGATSSQSSSRTRRQRESRSQDSRSRQSRDPSRERNRETRARDARERSRRQAEESVLLHPESSHAEERRRRRSESNRREGELREPTSRSRQVEHQSSLRSLISSGDMDSRDIAREVEDFARQIQEEGLLDGLDLDNIDLSNNDELSRRITEAYRRRQRDRTRHDAGRRSNASAHSHRSDGLSPESRSHNGDSSRPTSRQRAHSGPRPTSTNGHSSDERGRYPPSSHLEVQEPRRRRRTASSGRSATVPIAPTQPEPPLATRSQTDIAIRSQASELSSGRPSMGTEARSSSTPTMVTTQTTTESPNLRNLPFSARASTTGLGISQPQQPSTTVSELSGDSTRRPQRPASLVIAPSANFASPPTRHSGGMTSPTTTSPGHQRTRSQLYPEPSITCSRCGKEHIEYDLHYNCYICSGGDWNICLDCYRGSKGCLHWFGFGYSAWPNWEKARKAGDAKLAAPHMLFGNRYLKPKEIPGGADGRRTLTNENPHDRLQGGTFCQRCFAWANDCYWRCDVCNFGDWGFCNDCVNQGRCCTHPLLPLAYQPQAHDSQSPTPPASPSPRSPGAVGRPSTATFLTGPNAVTIGPFQPLTFTIKCELCKIVIPPANKRHHCYTCTSSLVPDSRPGDYNVCESCYAELVVKKVISMENGPTGWRRCPQGHRMIVTSFLEGQGGPRRVVLHDWVGGRRLQFLPCEGNPFLQICYWFEGEQKLERAVTVDVSATAIVHDAALAGTLTDKFPPEGGSGIRGTAHWAWYPKAGAEDELLFPKGAEITEIEDVNGDWYHGVYMGAKGLFPAPFLKVTHGSNAK